MFAKSVLGAHGPIPTSGIEQYLPSHRQTQVDSVALSPTHNKYAFVLTVTTLVVINGIDQSAGILEAEVRSEVHVEMRGASSSPFVPSFGPYRGRPLYMISVGSDSGSETAAFIFKNGDVLTLLTETVVFQTDALASVAIGTRQAPFLLTGNSTGVFSNEMTVTALVNIDGVEQASGWLVAHVQAEMRGYSNSPVAPTFGPHAGQLLYTILVGSNMASGETIHFLFRQHRATGTSNFRLTETLVFQDLEAVGESTDPFMLTGAATSVPSPIPGSSPTPKPDPDPNPDFDNTPQRHIPSTIARKDAYASWAFTFEDWIDWKASGLSVWKTVDGVMDVIVPSLRAGHNSSYGMEAAELNPPCSSHSYSLLSPLLLPLLCIVATLPLTAASFPCERARETAIGEDTLQPCPTQVLIEEPFEQNSYAQIGLPPVSPTGGDDVKGYLISLWVTVVRCPPFVYSALLWQHARQHFRSRLALCRGS